MQIKALEVSYNNILLRIWSLPHVSNTAIVHLVESVYNLLYHRFLKFAYRALNHDSVQLTT